MDVSDIDKSLLEKSDLTDGFPLLADSDCEEESMYEETQVKPRISDSVKYFVSIAVGITFGVVLNIFNVGDDMVTIVTIPGALFIRALQCAVIPMMFFNITTSVVDIFGTGSASSIGKRAISLYTLTTVLAALEGIAIANVFSSLLDSNEGLTDDDDGVKITMMCPKDLGTMTVDADGSLLCVHHDDLSSYNLTSKYQNFHLRDEEDQLVNGVVIEQSLVDQVQTTTYSVIPNNFTQAFATPNIVSVIVIAFVFGAAIVNLQRKPRAAGGAGTVLSVCKEMADVTNEIIGWIITLAPVCVGFLIATSVASAGHIIDLLRTVGVYALSVNVGLFLHICVMLPIVFFWYTGGENPYPWLYAIRQPLLVAFSTSSSAATVPVAIATLVQTGLVDEKTANTLLPMGASINMDGAAIGYPCAISFLAHSAKLERKLNAATWINVALGSSLGSAGAAPVPNAGVVMLVTVWETAFPGYAVPESVAYVQGIEFMIDRFQTVTNVCSDMFIARMIQCAVDKERKALPYEEQS